jgi:hypothetical protein
MSVSRVRFQRSTSIVSGTIGLWQGSATSSMGPAGPLGAGTAGRSTRCGGVAATRPPLAGCDRGGWTGRLAVLGVERPPELGGDDRLDNGRGR